MLCYFSIERVNHMVLCYKNCMVSFRSSSSSDGCVCFIFSLTASIEINMCVRVFVHISRCLSPSPHPQMFIVENAKMMNCSAIRLATHQMQFYWLICNELKKKEMLENGRPIGTQCFWLLLRCSSLEPFFRFFF